MLINDPKIEFIERLQMLKRIDPFHIYFQQLYHHGNGTVAVFMFTCKCTNLRAVTWYSLFKPVSHDYVLAGKASSQ